MRVTKSPGLACGLCVGDEFMIDRDRFPPETHQRIEPAARAKQPDSQPVARMPFPEMHELVRDACTQGRIIRQVLVDKNVVEKRGGRYFIVHQHEPHSSQFPGRVFPDQPGDGENVCEQFIQMPGCNATINYPKGL